MYWTPVGIVHVSVCVVIVGEIYGERERQRDRDMERETKRD